MTTTGPARRAPRPLPQPVQDRAVAAAAPGRTGEGARGLQVGHDGRLRTGVEVHEDLVPLELDVLHQSGEQHLAGAGGGGLRDPHGLRTQAHDHLAALLDPEQLVVQREGFGQAQELLAQADGHRPVERCAHEARAAG
ncbi:hypothetical protein RKD37_006938 [Streptomyces ambofaciens]